MTVNNSNPDVANVENSMAEANNKKTSPKTCLAHQNSPPSDKDAKAPRNVSFSNLSEAFKVPPRDLVQFGPSPARKRSSPLVRRRPVLHRKMSSHLEESSPTMQIPQKSSSSKFAPAKQSSYGDLPQNQSASSPANLTLSDLSGARRGFEVMDTKSSHRSASVLSGHQADCEIDSDFEFKSDRFELKSDGSKSRLLLKTVNEEQSASDFKSCTSSASHSSSSSSSETSSDDDDEDVEDDDFGFISSSTRRASADAGVSRSNMRRSSTFAPNAALIAGRRRATIQLTKSQTMNIGRMNNRLSREDSAPFGAIRTSFQSKRNLRGDAVFKSQEMQTFSEELSRMSEFAKIEVHVGVIAGLKQNEAANPPRDGVNSPPFCPTIESESDRFVFAPIRPILSSPRLHKKDSIPATSSSSSCRAPAAKGSDDKANEDATPQSELANLKALLHGYGLPTDIKNLEKHLSCHDLISSIDKSPSSKSLQGDLDSTPDKIETSAVSKATLTSNRSTSSIQKSNAQKASFHRHMGNLLDRPGHQATILRRWRTSLRGDMQTSDTLLACDEKKYWMKALYQAFVRMLRFGGIAEPNDVQLREIVYEMRKTYVDKVFDTNDAEAYEAIAQVKDDIIMAMEPFVEAVVNTIKSDYDIDGEPGMDPRYSEDQYRATADWIVTRFDQLLDKIWPKAVTDSSKNTQQERKKSVLKELPASFQALVDSSRLHTASVQKMNAVLSLYSENVQNGDTCDDIRTIAGASSDAMYKSLQKLKPQQWRDFYRQAIALARNQMAVARSLTGLFGVLNDTQDDQFQEDIGKGDWQKEYSNMRTR
jgi:hypothetical protein